MRRFRNYPYQNLQDLNLDYLLRIADEAEKVLKEIGGYDDRIEELEKYVADIRAGKFTPEMEKELYEIETRILEIVEKDVIKYLGEMVRFVFFGLTDDGYFTAYIPDPWNAITFNTTNYDIVIPNVEEYGRLVLSY